MMIAHTSEHGSTTLGAVQSYSRVEISYRSTTTVLSQARLTSRAAISKLSMISIILYFWMKWCTMGFYPRL